jgi:hypothetical protein
MSYGNYIQKEKLAEELKKLPDMTATEEVEFNKKMKKFSNLAKLAESTDRMKV